LKLRLDEAQRLMPKVAALQQRAEALQQEVAAIEDRAELLRTSRAQVTKSR
jgi:prefoldin subunit 5